MHRGEEVLCVSIRLVKGQYASNIFVDVHVRIELRPEKYSFRYFQRIIKRLCLVQAMPTAKVDGDRWRLFLSSGSQAVAEFFSKYDLGEVIHAKLSFK